MRLVSQVRSWLRAVLRRSAMEREMEQEWRFHLDVRIEDLVSSGLSAAEAEARARAEFGFPIKWKEESREARGLSWLDDFLRDLSYAGRQLRRSPGCTLTAVTVFALGIGATTAIVSVIQAVLIRPLPFANADRLVQLIDRVPADERGPARTTPTALDLDELGELQVRSRTLTRVGLYTGGNLTMTGRGDPVRLVATRMSAEFPAMLGDQPFLGRTFGPNDEAAGHAPAVVLAFSAWQRYFGGARDVLGQPVTLDGRPHIVIGVMPSTFAFPDRITDVWMPFVSEPQAGVSRRFFVYGEIADGVPFQAAVTEVSGLLQELKGFATVEDYVAAGEPLPFGLVGLRETLVAPVRPALMLLAGAATAVLLLACINVTTLLLARGTARQREIGIRVALGASFSRLIRQLLTESVLVSAVGGFAGLWIAASGIALLRVWGTGLLRRDLGQAISIPRLAEVGLDGSTASFAAAVAIASGVAAGLWPAIRHAIPEWLGHPRRTDARSSHGASRQLNALGSLVVAQIAVAIVLTVGGVLLMHSFVNLSRVDLGFEPANALTFQVSFPTGRYDRDAIGAFSSDIVASVREIPGVDAGAYAHFLPMVQARAGGPMTRTPSPTQSPHEPGISPGHIWVHHDFLQTLGMTLFEGRSFSADDRAGRPKVVVVNQALAASGLLGSHPIGQSFYFGMDGPWEVIGVVKDFARFGLDLPAEPIVLFDARQRPPLPGAGGISPYIVIRTTRRAADILPDLRTAVSRIDRDAAIVNIATMNEILGHTVSRPRLYAAGMSVFAIAAVLIAAVGLGGIVACAVAERTREIGIRLAVGASREHVLRLFLVRSLRLAVLGIVIGLGATVALSRSLEGLLFGVSPLEPNGLATATALVLVVVMVAAWLPARRAASVDPLMTLRAE